MKKVMRKHMEERFGKVFNYSLNPPLPKSLNIELNNTCNQKCIFCPFHGENALQHPKPSALELSFVKRIIDQASELGIGSKEIGFYLAGEAFLYNKLPEVVKYAKDKGFRYSFLTSNGALASPDKLKAVIEAGLDSIRFSINAMNREDYRDIHGADDFDKVIKNIEYLRDYKNDNNLKIATSISCVITKKNYDTRYDIKKYLEPYVDEVVFIPIEIERLKNRQQLVEELAIYEDRGQLMPNFICPMLFDTMYINSDGMVVPCCNAYDYKCTFFDLNKNLDLKAAWYSDIYNKYRGIFLEGKSDEGTICQDCILRRNGLSTVLMD